MHQTASHLKNEIEFPMYAKNHAPEGAKTPLDRLEQSVGMIPNLAATMAGSPALIDGFVTLRETIQHKAGFSPSELELIFLTNATANACDYCQCVHGMFAQKAGLDAETIQAVREEKPLADSRLHALATFARNIVKKKAKLAPAEIQDFLNAGFTQQHVLDLVACVAQSVMANYTNHMAGVVLDEALQSS